MNLLHASVVLIICLTLVGNSLADITILEAEKYLKTYGFMSQDEGVTDLRKALELFQTFSRIEVTGLLDPQTKAVMTKPRCGIEDKQGGKLSIAHEFNLLNSRWEKSELTYRVSNHHRSLNEVEVDEDIRDALLIWSKYTPITFREVHDDDADIKISFETGDHGDGKPFLPGTSVIAHAFAPGRERGGDVHFNNDIAWTTGSQDYDRTNLYNVAAHEFGHALGIDHSNILEALMAPAYSTKNFRNNLHSDDIMAIQNLYGNKGGLPPNNELCQINKIDTILTTGSGNVIVFKDKFYWRLPLSKYPNFPKKITDNLPELPEGIDAAFTNTEKDTYYFKNDTVWKYNVRTLYPGFPKRISVEFPGIPTYIDTVFQVQFTEKLFFFKGDLVWGFERNKTPKVASKYPVNITNWGVPTPFDGVFINQDDIYIFKERKFYKLNVTDNTVESGFPKPLRGNLFQC